MKLTENFTLEEMVRSATAQRLGIDNTPLPFAESQLSRLARNVLQPLRDAYGKPILVTSGFRTGELNEAVGGAKTSQHMLGQAADIIAPGTSSMEQRRRENRRLFDLVIELQLPFDQLIDEKDYAWVHVSHCPRNRRQVLHLR